MWYQKKVSKWAPKKVNMIPQNWKISCVGIGQNFNLGTQWKTHKSTIFCIALWLRFVFLFWNSFLTKFPLCQYCCTNDFLDMYQMRHECGNMIYCPGSEWSLLEQWLLEKYCEWTLDMLSLRHSTYPRPLPLLVIHYKYKQRKKVKYKSQILKTSIFQSFKNKWRQVFNVLQTFHICPSFSLQCRFCEIWLGWHFHQSSHADVITHFM